MKDRTGKTLSNKEILGKIISRIKAIRLDFNLMLLCWAGGVPSHLFRLFCYRLAGIKIGAGSHIHMWARFYQPRGIEIGKDTIIGDHCFLGCNHTD